MNPPSASDSSSFRDDKLKPHLNSAAVRDATQSLEQRETPTDWSSLRVAWELLKPAASIGVAIGFTLLLTYALRIGRLPRFGSAHDASFLLLAFCLVGIGTWMLIWVGLVGPGRIAVFSRPNGSVHTAERFSGLFLFFLGVCFLWVGAGAIFAMLHGWHLLSASEQIPHALTDSFLGSWLFIVGRQLPHECAVLLLWHVTFSAVWDFAADSLDPDYALSKINRAKSWIFVVTALGRTIYLALRPHPDGWQLEETFLLLEFAVCVWLFSAWANVIIERFAKGVLRGRLKRVELTMAGLMMFLPVYLTFLLMGWSLEVRIPLLLLAIAIINARVALPFRQLRFQIANVLSAIALLGSFALLCPTLSAFAMQRLGVGNVVVAQIRMQKTDFDLYAPPPNVVLTKDDSKGTIIELRDLHLAYDLGNEIVFQLPTKMPTGTTGPLVPWVLPRDKVHGYFPRSRE